MTPLTPRRLINGVLFSMFWASASVAGKFGLKSVEPLTLFSFRFLLAGIILLLVVHVFQKVRMPIGKEWLQLSVFGTFNTALYLGLFIIALQFITPGITTLAIALNPLLISIMTAVWLKRKIHATEWLSIVLGITGIVAAAYPLLTTSQATPVGLLLLAASMIAYSFGSVYYAAVQWRLPRPTINAWQVLIGGVIISPMAYFTHSETNNFDLNFWLSLAWLIFPVSILAVQLWLWLLKTDVVRASLWLYLCPIFGFLYASVLLGEPLTGFTAIGTALVLGALYLGQRKHKQDG